MSSVTVRYRWRLTCAFALIACFYVWTAATSGFAVAPAPQLDGYYNFLAKGFLAGQLNLSVTPSPQLLALPDPYDPIANVSYRLHDAALFDGKYYLYFGPTPALLLFAPFRLITGLDFPQPLAIALFCSAGLLFAFLLLQYVANHLLPTPLPSWLVVGGMVAIGFCNVAPFLLRRPQMYEVAISCGYALVFAGLYTVVSGSLGIQPHNSRIALGSALIGLAGGARFPLLAGALALLILAGQLLWKQWREPLLIRSATQVAFFAPLGLCLLLLGWYNYARFGSWTEFGINYTLQGVSPKEYQFFNLQRLPYGFLYYVFVPVRWSPTFPFAVLDPHSYLPPPSFMYVEPVAGLLMNSPLLAILAVAPFVLPRERKFRIVFLASILIGLVLLALYCISGVTMRYEVDFATFFTLPALLLWFKLWQDSSSRGRLDRWVAVLGFSTLLTISVASNLLISFTGYYDNLKTAQPTTYESLHDMFRPVERLFAPRLQLLGIEAPNGLERQEADTFFWLGGSAAIVRVASQARQEVDLAAIFVPGPSVGEAVATRRLRVRALGTTHDRVVSNGPGTIRVTVDRGETVVSLEALDEQTIFIQPNGDTRPLILGIRGLRIESHRSASTRH